VALFADSIKKIISSSTKRAKTINIPLSDMGYAKQRFIDELILVNTNKSFTGFYNFTNNKRIIRFGPDPLLNHDI